MAGSTPRGINYPTAEDKIKDGTSPSALAADFMGTASSADVAISQGVQEAKDDADEKYGGLPQRVAEVETKNTEQDLSLDLLLETTQAIDAPIGFDANSVTKQAVHMVNGMDDAINMPGPGSWTLLTYPNETDGSALQQVAVQYSTSGPQLLSRVKSSGGWSAWMRLDAADIRPAKAVRFENGKWVWDLAEATHYVLIDHNGKPTVRATPWPQPSPTTPVFTW